jgi:photosystem II stability/assembly factor-like uncharacterized protein
MSSITVSRLGFAPLALSLSLALSNPSWADATATRVSDAWDRPAVMGRTPERSVLLGAARAGARLVAIGERGVVVVSDDHGKRWVQSPTPVSATLTAVRFADSQHGYIVGHAGTVLATADGGGTWTRKLDGRRIAGIELEAAKASGDPVQVKSAERLVADGPDKPLLDVLVFGAQHALVVGAYGLALETRDGGINWTSWRARLPNPKELHLYTVRKREDSIVIAGERGLVLQSNDGGSTFRRIVTPYAGSFFTSEVRATGEIVLAGLRGNVWRSNDHGATWTQLVSPMPVTITGTTLRADGMLLFANQAGRVLGVDGGALKLLHTPALPPLTGLVAIDDGRLLALSVQGVQFLEAP